MRNSYVVLAALVAALLPSDHVAAQACAEIPYCDSCPNTAICDACQSGRFFVVPPGGSPTCQTCTVCQGGEVEISACSPFIDRQCAAACPAGTIDVGGSCEDCGVFDCATCSAPGTCTECADGFYLDAGSCVACTPCNANEIIVTACSGTQDATCAACGTGTVPNATATACVPVCGDGLLAEPEACDDANMVDGDGCSSTCTQETSYHCSGVPSNCMRVGVAGGGGGCSTVGRESLPLSWLPIPFALVYFVFRRRRNV